MNHPRHHKGSPKDKKKFHSLPTALSLPAGHRLKRKAAFFVALVAMGLYANTLHHGYVLDDYSVIKENWIVKKGIAGIPDILKTSYRYGYWNDAGTLYRPLALIMFAVEYQLSPGNSSISHFGNIILYALTGFILTVLLFKLLAGHHPFIPLIISLFFISHPVHTEVVANIKSRDEILCFLFALISVLLLLNFIEKNKKTSLVLSLISFLFAFFSKENAIVYLAIFPLVLWFFTDTKLKQIVFISVLYLLPALIYLVCRRVVLGDVMGEDKVDVIDNLLVAAPGKISQVATALVIIGKYFYLLVFPHPLSCDYSYNQIPAASMNDPVPIISLFILIILIAFSVAGFFKKNLFSFAILFSLVTFSIYSNLLLLIGSSMGERFLYHASLGYVMITGMAIGKFFYRGSRSFEITSWKTFIPANKFIFIFCLLIAALYGYKTIVRNRDWQSNYSLYKKDVITSPNSARTHYYYALELVQSKALKTGNPSEKNKYLDMAIAEFSRAAEIYPPYPDAYDQRGLAWYRKGNLEQAMESYELALKYNPGKATTLSNMGAIYFNAGNYSKALESYQKAVQYHPRFADAWWNLGSTCATLGKFGEAIKAYHESLRYDTENAMVYYFLGITYEKTGDQNNARKYLDIAYRMKPELRK
ncbi:MAG: tetratricopeptide repeat protein [Bacteroidetes bacterium]|nr:tetratricopeptide repeat protein [Bacteroidota bacterium]